MYVMLLSSLHYFYYLILVSTLGFWIASICDMSELCGFDFLNLILRTDNGPRPLHRPTTDVYRSLGPTRFRTMENVSPNQEGSWYQLCRK